MTPRNLPSPATLSYVAALRGTAPRPAGSNFAYAVAYCRQPYLLMCLAASNPEGQFYGLMPDAAACAEAGAQARARMVDNVAFFPLSPHEIAEKIEKDQSPLPPLHYLCADETATPLSAEERAALFNMAAHILLPGGLLNIAYRAQEGSDDALRFLVQEFAPEMDLAQAKEFLQELKALGGHYFARNPERAAKLEGALAGQVPDAFFDSCNAEGVRAPSFETLMALRPRGFAYMGDSSIAANYVELSVPPAAQDIIIACRENPLYEPLKDFALDRVLRSDIWCRQPAAQSGDMAELFGSFAYGIVMPRDQIPSTFNAEGKTVDLSSPLFTKLIDLMTLMPVTIGDFLAHPDGKGLDAMEVVGAVQILIACGLAQPMRGAHGAGSLTSLAQPRLAGGLNSYLDKTAVTGEDLWLASPVLGTAMSVSARDALVMQALNRAGLANSVSALLPELERLAQNPMQASKVMDTAQPTAETAQNMIEDSVRRSAIQWYAYGLMEAA